MEFKKEQLICSQKDIYNAIPDLVVSILTASPKQSGPDVIMPIMDAAFMFAADFIRYLQMRGCKPNIAPIKIQRFLTVPRCIYMPQISCFRGKNVLIVDTIYDTGKTMEHAVRDILDARASTVMVATLFARNKKDMLPNLASKYPVLWANAAIDLKGSTDYLVGYGMDYNGEYRGLPDVYGVKQPDE